MNSFIFSNCFIQVMVEVIPEHTLDEMPVQCSAPSQLMEI